MALTPSMSHYADWTIMNDFLGHAAGRVVLGDNLDVLATFQMRRST